MDFFRSRRLAYQILALIDQRWQIVAAFDDGRDKLGRSFDRLDLEKLEREVEAQARKALTVPGVRSVKVVRERIREDGFALEEEILKLDASTAPPPERQVAGYAGAVPVCAGAEDLLHRPALRVIGLILRPLLDRLNLTAVELVALSGLSRSVQKADAALNQAIATAARQQAAELKVTARARIDALEAVLKAGYQRLRTAEQLKDPPRLGPGGLEAYLDAAARRVPEGERRFWGLRGLAQRLAGGGSYGAKLELLMPLAALPLGPVAADLLDETAASIVDQPDLVRELLGRPLDLRGAILRLADLAEGMAPPGPEASAMATGLAALLADARLPKTAEAIRERALRSLESKQALAHDGLAGEWAAVGQLQRDLLPRLPPTQRPAAEAALARRAASARQQMLDGAS